MAVDARNVGRVLFWMILVALGAGAVGVALTGAASNRRIDRLRQQGAAVVATVTGCEGLLGGSGSNGVGYTCRAEFRIGGRTRSEVLPGIAPRAPGSRIGLVVVPTDPKDLATPAGLSREHPSSRPFWLAGLLLAGAAAMALVGYRSSGRAGRRGRAPGGV